MVHLDLPVLQARADPGTSIHRKSGRSHQLRLWRGQREEATGRSFVARRHWQSTAAPRLSCCRVHGTATSRTTIGKRIEAVVMGALGVGVLGVVVLQQSSWRSNGYMGARRARRQSGARAARVSTWRSKERGGAVGRGLGSNGGEDGEKRGEEEAPDVEGCRGRDEEGDGGRQDNGEVGRSGIALRREGAKAGESMVRRHRLRAGERAIGRGVAGRW